MRQYHPARMGTLVSILKESGFERRGKTYRPGRFSLVKKSSSPFPPPRGLFDFANRPIHYRKLVRVLELERFCFVRERGDHMIFTKTGIQRPIAVPRYDALPVFISKNVLRTAQTSRERYLELSNRL
jgi:predicted RNA binding protein YcfA (HicA-like mRNA interferase family)